MCNTTLNVIVNGAKIFLSLEEEEILFESMFVLNLPLFLIIGGILTALMVISMKNPVHAVFSLIMTFCFSSMLLLTILCDFLAIVFVVVYVGAIAVLFLFVVMMLNIKFVQFSENVLRYIPFSIFIVLVFVNEMFFGKIQLHLENILENDWIYYIIKADIILLLAEVLYTTYFHIFLIAGLILLIAMIGTINITLYHARNVKRQLLYKQLGRDAFLNIIVKI